MPALAINGGDALRDRPFHRWPVGDPTDVEVVRETILSGKWFATTGPNVEEFEQAFAAHQGASTALPSMAGLPLYRWLARRRRRSGGRGRHPVVHVRRHRPRRTECRGGPGLLRCRRRNIQHGRFFRRAGHNRAHYGDYAGPLGWTRRRYGRRAETGRESRTKGRRGLLSRLGRVLEGAGGLGSIGFSGGFSFQASKNLTAGEGGFVTTSDDEAAEVARHMMWAGAGDREGKTSILGSNYRMSQISAALLLNQLKRLDEQNRVRMSNSIYLSDALDEIDGFRSVPRNPDVTVDSVYQYVFRYKRDEFEGVPRETFVEAMNAEGIPVGKGYAKPLQDYPLMADIPDSMPGGHPFASGCYKGSVDYSTTETPVTERLCKEESLTLPSNVFLGPRSDVDDVIAAVDKVRSNVAELLEVAAV